MKKINILDNEKNLKLKSIKQKILMKKAIIQYFHEEIKII